MNITMPSLFNETMQNVSNAIYGNYGDIPLSCHVKGNQFSTECILKTFCGGMSDWVLNTGLTIIISYIVISWLLWWFMNHGYKRCPDKSFTFWGNIHNIETRRYWDEWVRARISKVMLAFIVIVIYMYGIA